MWLSSAVSLADGPCWERGELHVEHSWAAASGSAVVAAVPVDPVMLQETSGQSRLKAFRELTEGRTLYFG